MFPPDHLNEMYSSGKLGLDADGALMDPQVSYNCYNLLRACCKCGFQLGNAPLLAQRGMQLFATRPVSILRHVGSSCFSHVGIHIAHCMCHCVPCRMYVTFLITVVV